MMYAILAEAVALAFLWGLWRKAKADLTAMTAAFDTVKGVVEQAGADRAALITRYEGQLTSLQNELSTVYEALNAKATPADLRDELNRVLSR